RGRSAAPDRPAARSAAVPAPPNRIRVACPGSGPPPPQASGPVCLGPGGLQSNGLWRQSRPPLRVCLPSDVFLFYGYRPAPSPVRIILGKPFRRNKRFVIATAISTTND